MAAPSAAPTRVEGAWGTPADSPEARRAPYDADDYAHPQVAEPAIAERQGGWWSPYKRGTFAERVGSDTDHIVAKSEAHDSVPCRKCRRTRLAFARDPATDARRGRLYAGSGRRGAAALGLGDLTG